MKTGSKLKTVIGVIVLAVFFILGSQFILSEFVNRSPTPKISGWHNIKSDTLNLYDSSQTRLIPVLLYSENIDSGKDLKVAILAPGHGIRNSEYSFIATNLAARGYVVASIQYELPQDEEIEITGNVYEALKPGWEQSVTYILFVTQYLKKIYPNLDFEHLTLIGHSRGGDVLMLFAQKYPELVSKVISLDNNHVPLPRTKKPQIFSLRANNTKPDKGVLPTPAEQEKYQIQIIKLKDISHMDMCFGTANQKEEINRYITEFLKNLN